MRGATSTAWKRSTLITISIHAPLAGSDDYGDTRFHRCNISIHAPLAGSDLRHIQRHTSRHISIHAPLAGSDGHDLSHGPVEVISIHAPLAGSDLILLKMLNLLLDFNPRSPCGERLNGCDMFEITANFNPRSPCGERPDQCEDGGDFRNFNPRSPCGERLTIWIDPEEIGGFQSTLPLRGATKISRRAHRGCLISIHAPLAGSDSKR